ncbi:MAG: SBBP repeat-containing protein [candidate division Zixibacteria bacterium]|nr:SBBP repeat-containing protein [candidate division Zixibacteria bacterium]
MTFIRPTTNTRNRIPLIPLLFIALLCTANALAQSAIPSPSPRSYDGPLSFTPNRGQWDDSISFRTTMGGATMWFNSSCAYYQFSQQIRTAGGADSGAAWSDPANRAGANRQRNESHLIRANFVEADPNARIIGVEETGSHSSYYLGSDQSKWRTNVPNYRVIVYESIYPGIDLKYYGNDRQMEYDFIVAPGADLSLIQVRYEGVKSVSANPLGELVIETDWGKIVEQAPVVYQVIDGEGIPLSGEYKLVSQTTFGFTLGAEYDPAYAVVIDPKLVYSSYFGGSGDDFSCSIRVDDLGYVYLTGTTTSANFPVDNAYDTTLGGTQDMTITKFSPDLHTIIYSTYFGGMADEVWGQMSIDAEGNVFIAGDTRSSDFPLRNAYDGVYKGSSQSDAFLAKFDTDGNLVFSTFFGGTSDDSNIRLAVDRLGYPYIGGSTFSTNLPVKSAFDPNSNGYQDMFVAKFSPDGQSLIYCSYLGGSNWEELHGIAVDTGLCLYTTCHTASSNYPKTSDAYDTTLNGNYDCAVTKIAAGGTSLVYSTFVGGSQYDGGHDVFVDLSGHAYVSGGTGSFNFPTVNAFDNVYNGTASPGSWGDGFIFKLSQGGDSLEYSTFIGGSTNDVLGTILVDNTGRAIANGQTQATDYPTKYAYDAFYSGGWDATLVILSQTGRQMEYGTYIGGTGDEGLWAMAIDHEGSLYLGGLTSSVDFAILNAYQGSLAGQTDMYIMKFTCDIDDDGLCDVVDNCPALANSGQVDSDLDGVGDLCDDCTDSDADGYGDPGFPVNTCMQDNCPLASNPEQEDFDFDGVGNACDNCVSDFNPDQADRNANGIGDVCDGCCVVRVGNANGLGTYPNEVTISDIQLMVTAKFISSLPCDQNLPCLAEADVNQSGGANPACKDITIADIQTLVNHLFIAGPANAPLKNCL